MTKFTVTRVRDINTLEPVRAMPKKWNGDEVSPVDFAAQLLHECESAVDGHLFEGSRPSFDVIVEHRDRWEVTVIAIYPRGCAPAQAYVRKLRGEGVETTETRVTIIRATME